MVLGLILFNAKGPASTELPYAHYYIKMIRQLARPILTALAFTCTCVIATTAQSAVRKLSSPKSSRAADRDSERLAAKDEIRDELAELHEKWSPALRSALDAEMDAHSSEAALSIEPKEIVATAPPLTPVFVTTLPEKKSNRKSNKPSENEKPAFLSGGEVKQKMHELARAPASDVAHLAEPGIGLSEQIPLEELKKLADLDGTKTESARATETPLIFDIPVTYNEKVRQWIRYFQTDGRPSFRSWLERSPRFLPVIQYELSRSGLPTDLVYVAMVESGFSTSASSTASAVGIWQFIAPTANRYGLKTDWWIDERRDFHKSTRAAIHYMTDLFSQFNSWYLVAASYNMGENGVRRLIQRHHTVNFWELAERGALPNETSNYVPKIIAAMLISKAPALYGFRDLEYQMPLSFETATVPGGTDLLNLASYLGVSEKYLKDLNPELIRGFIPKEIKGHKIRIPKGSFQTVSQYVRLQTAAR